MAWVTMKANGWVLTEDFGDTLLVVPPLSGLMTQKALNLQRSEAGQFYYQYITIDNLDVDSKVSVLFPQPKIPTVRGLGFQELTCDS